MYMYMYSKWCTHQTPIITIIVFLELNIHGVSVSRKTWKLHPTKISRYMVVVNITPDVLIRFEAWAKLAQQWLWAISIEKRNFDPWKWNVDQNTKITPYENIPLYGIKCSSYTCTYTCTCNMSLHIFQWVIRIVIMNL